MARSPFSTYGGVGVMDFSRGPNLNESGTNFSQSIKTQLSVVSIDENEPLGERLDIEERSYSGRVSISRSSRSQSLADVEFGLERASSLGNGVGDSMLYDTNASLESGTDFSISSVAAKSEARRAKWQRSLQLVEKGLAFNKAFISLSSNKAENIIDPNRLTKVKEIGSGSFATVELCKLKSTEPDGKMIDVAVKRLRPEFLRTRKDLERFFKEAELLRKLDHRYIAAYVGVGNLSNIAREEVATITAKEARRLLKSTYIVQEFINGGSLKGAVIQQMMKIKDMTYTDAEACLWMSQIAEGLQYLHSSVPKIVHRDLKLENILLKERSGGKEACLVDFGVSAMLPFTGLRKDSASSMKLGRSSVTPSIQEEGETWRSLSENIEKHMQEVAMATSVDLDALHIDESAAHDLTGRTGSFMYMAPEVYKAQQYNEKADVFSFGVVMYEVFSRLAMSTVVVGPTGDPAAAKVYANKVSNGYRRPFSKSLQDTEIAELIADCWSQEPKQRPSISTVLGRLQALQGTMSAKGSFSGKRTVGSKVAKKEGMSSELGARSSSGCFACFS